MTDRDSLMSSGAGARRIGAGTKALAKAMRILEAFTENAPEWGVTELSRHLSLSKSTVSEILRTLTAFDLVEQSPTSRRYHIGLRALELGFLASSALVLRDDAIPHLETLKGQTNRIVYLAVPRGFEMLYVASLHPTQRQVSYSGQGRRGPMYCTGIGKAALAWMPGAFLEAYLEAVPLSRETANTICDRDGLVEELKLTRERGFSVDRQERELGIQCVGAPILSVEGAVRAAISVSGSARELPEEEFQHYADLVTDAARSITKRLASIMI